MSDKTFFLKDILRSRSKSSELEKIKKILKKARVRVYLTGPITYREEQLEYRESIKKQLEKISPKFEVVDPAKQTSPLRTKMKLKRKGNHEKIAEQIITGDLKEISKCDAIVAYIPTFSVGSPMEIFFAYRILEIPVLTIFTRRSARYPPPWLAGNSSILFSSKRDLFTFLKEQLKKMEREEDE